MGRQIIDVRTVALFSKTCFGVEMNTGQGQDLMENS